MPASILDGKIVSQHIRQEIHDAVLKRAQRRLISPGLAVILVGDDPASEIYVKNKHQACLTLGFHSIVHKLPKDTSEAELLHLIETLNQAHDIHGILVQLPLPAHIHTTAIIERIDPKKDVDGFHPYNLGRLAQGNPTLRPCTPFGIMTLLKYYQLNIAGLNAVIIGASNIVGRPMALELLAAKATITVCHSATPDLEQHVRMADLIVTATGVRDLIKSDWFQPHQIAIDVGIHRLPHDKLRGDLDFNIVSQKVAWITPVPGGVGPMTISMLLFNTLQAAELSDTPRAAQ